MDLNALLAGFGLGLSLIVAIGAQNAFVLRQGVRREHLLAVAAICIASDLVLIAAGVSGIGAVLAVAPWLVDVVRWCGAAFLLGYGLLAARRALRPNGTALGATGAGRASGATASVVPVVLTTLALTWLNPHVYLDTVFLLGSVANSHGEDRWTFAVGAGTGSALWFTALASGARFLGRWLDSPRAWRLLDGAIALIMLALAVTLVLAR